MRRIQNGKPITNYKYNFVFGHLKGKHTELLYRNFQTGPARSVYVWIPEGGG